jgi:prepilin-type N-terminal cleavage/methylation domain-containing protein
MRHMRMRGGFTLWEMAIVLAVMAVSAIMVAPAIGRLGTEQARQPAAELLALLHDARKAAIDGNSVVTLRLDPVSGHYRADTAGVNGSGVLAEGTLQLDATETLDTRLLRLQFVFRPTGASLGDTVLVRAADRSVLVGVDPWSGVARADAR